MSYYSNAILSGSPGLYWRLNEFAGNTAIDQSGNGRDGTYMTGQVAGIGGMDLLQPGALVPATPVGHADANQAVRIKGSWSGNPLTQAYPGTGVRANNYKPFVVGSRRSFECWLYKTEAASFATMFSADGSTGPSPVTPHPTWEWGSQMLRFYPNVDTYPVGWVDWGSPNSGIPSITFGLNAWFHVVTTFDDTTSIAELFLNAVSQGTLGPLGYAGSTLHYNIAVTPGNFQIGWRGGAPTFPNPGNGETMGGVMDEVAVYEYILSPEQIRQHYRIGHNESAINRTIRERVRAL